MAKRFQFRLQQVLDFRKRIEEIRARELAEAKSSLLRHEELMKARQKEEELFLEQYKNFEKVENFSAAEAAFQDERQEQFLKRKRSDQVRLSELSSEVEEKRKSVVQASKDRQLLENLMERQRNLHSNELAREEQKFLDEISSIAFMRRERTNKPVNHFVNLQFSLPSSE